MKSNTSTSSGIGMKANRLLSSLILLGALLLGACTSRPRVGALRSESRAVELGDAESARVEIHLGAGDLRLKGGAEKLLEAGFTYNVALLKPEVEYTDGTLVVRQPETEGMPVLRNITDFRNEWGLRLYDDVPMDLRVDVGGGVSDLQLAGLSLTRLDVTLGTGESTIDLTGDWADDLDITIDAGAAGVTVRLPKGIGVRVEVDRGPTIIDAPGLLQDGNVYTNAAYGVSEVTLHIDITAGIGWLNLELAGDE
jgi:hypothetical protein